MPAEREPSLSASRRRSAPTRSSRHLPARGRRVPNHVPGRQRERGIQIAAGTLDGSRALRSAGPLAESVAQGPRPAAAGAAHADAVGPRTPAQQERYLQAVGLLQRYDRRDNVEKALENPPGARGGAPQFGPRPGRAGARQPRRCSASRRTAHGPTGRIAAAEAARALDPALPEVDITLGETLLATGRTKEAVEAFRRALAQRPDDFEALLGLGRANETDGDDAAAEEAFQRAIELQPSLAGYNQLGLPLQRTRPLSRSRRHVPARGARPRRTATAGAEQPRGRLDHAPAISPARWRHIRKALAIRRSNGDGRGQPRPHAALDGARGGRPRDLEAARYGPQRLPHLGQPRRRLSGPKGRTGRRGGLRALDRAGARNSCASTPPTRGLRLRPRPASPRRVAAGRGGEWNRPSPDRRAEGSRRLLRCRHRRRARRPERRSAGLDPQGRRRRLLPRDPRPPARVCRLAEEPAFRSIVAAPRKAAGS